LLAIKNQSGQQNLVYFIVSFFCDCAPTLQLVGRWHCFSVILSTKITKTSRKSFSVFKASLKHNRKNTQMTEKFSANWIKRPKKN